MTEVVLAAPGIAQEAELVAEAPRAGVRVLRRCVDAADLLAACAVDDRVVAVVSVALPRLSADVVARCGTVIGLAGDRGDCASLERLGITEIVELPAGLDAAEAWPRIRQAAQRRASSAPGTRATGVWRVDEPQPVTGRAALASDDSEGGDGRGQLIAVWGPIGSPGRTTIALGVAEALADAGQRTCVVDADTYAPSVALALALPDATGGLLRACRHADGRSLGPDALAAFAPRVRGRLHVLGGLAQVDRWPELRGPALDSLWAACRVAFDVTVVDVGFCLEQDDGPAALGLAAFGAARHAAALTALGQADAVLAVGDGTSAGAARLVAAWPGLERATTAPVTVVCNRPAQRDWPTALAALGVAAPVHRVPADARALAACWSRGRTLREGARRSRVRRSLTALADGLMRR